MKRLILLSSFLLLLPSVARAQNITTTTCPGAGCVNFDTAGQGSLGIQITGTWVGTITFQGTIDSANYVSISVTPSNSGTTVTTTTANGVWTTAVAGLTQVRVVFTAFTSGTAVVQFRSTITTKGATGSGGGGGGSGTVTSVGLTVPAALLAVSGSPVTTSGTLAVSLGTRAANLVFAGPTSGGVATPTFRSLVTADLPAGSTPGGSNTQIQFNDSNAFGGDAGLTYNKTTKNVQLNAQPFLRGISDTTNNSEPALLVYPATGTQVSHVLASIFTDTDNWAGLWMLSNSSDPLVPQITIQTQLNGSRAGTMSIESNSLTLNGGTAGIFAVTDVTLSNGKALKPNTTTANTALLQAYDVDDATYRTFATLTNGNTPSLTITPPTGGTVSLGTPTTLVLTNATGLPVSTGISGLGTGVATALAVNVGSAGAFTTFNGAHGTPSSITLTNGTGLPLTTGVTGTLPVANGGTNLTAAADDNVMVGNGTTWETKAVANCTDTGGNHLNYTASTNSFSCGTSSGSGGAALSAITAATGANTIASGNNTGQVWNWAITTNSTQGIKFGETTAATGGSSGIGDTQAIFYVATLSTSTAIPVIIDNNSSSRAGLIIKDATANVPSPTVFHNGRIGFGVDPGNALIYYDATSAGTANQALISYGTSGGTFVIDDAGGAARIGTTTNNVFDINQAGNIAVRFGTGGFATWTNQMIQSAGTKPTLSGACNADTGTGGAQAGTFTSRTTGTCAVTLTFNSAATTGWSCSATDITTAVDALFTQTGGSTTTATFSSTTVSGDVIRFNCMAY